MSKKSVWTNPIEEAAWRERWCRTCFQPDEALHRVMNRGNGCPHLQRAAVDKLPTAWKRRRGAVMGETYVCTDYLSQPPVVRRHSTPAPTGSLFDDTLPQQNYRLIPVEGWPDWRAIAANDTPEKL